MGAVDSNGVWKYDAADTVSTWESFLNLGMNSVSNAITNLRMNSVYKAASEAEAGTVRDNLVASGLVPTPANPIMIYITTNGKFMAWDGSGWKRNGDAVENWARTGTVELNSTTTELSNGMLWGKVGTAEAYTIESGTAVVKASTQWTSGGRKIGSYGYFSLSNRYTGISTVCLANGNAEAMTLAFSSDDNGWDNSVKDANGRVQKIRVVCPGSSVGKLLRVNYIVIGWRVIS